LSGTSGTSGTGRLERLGDWDIGGLGDWEIGRFNYLNKRPSMLGGFFS